MSAMLVVLGMSVLALVLWDVLSTTVAVSGGAGIVTSRTSRWLWLGLARLADRTAPRKLRVVAGPLVLLCVLLTWVTGVLLGWTLVFAAGPWQDRAGDAVEATLPQMLQYVAGSVLGQTQPEVFPAGVAATLGEVVAALSGAVSVGLVVAYVLPVVSAVVDGRQLAAYVATLGHTPAEIIERCWDGESHGDLDLHLIALTPQVTAQAEKHLAYPVLFYFHSLERHTSLHASLVVLDEAITLVDCCTSPRLQDSALVPVRIAISEFLDTLRHAHITAGRGAPPAPDPVGDDLADLPLLEPDAFGDVYDDIDDRRELLLALLLHAGWDWDDLTHGELADGGLDRLALRAQRPGPA